MGTGATLKDGSSNIILLLSRGSHARGVTIVELVVVLAIVGLLTALLLPAVQMAREAARRTECQSHLKQLGIANHSYHDVNRSLPISVGPWFPTVNGLNGKGWIVSILPQVEQQPLFDSFSQFFNGHFFAGGGINATGCRDLMKTRLGILECPSDSHRLYTTFFQWETIEVAATSYKGVIGDSTIGSSKSVHNGSLPDCHAVGNCNGLVFRLTYREPQALFMIADGASNTFLIGEDIPDHNDHSTAYYANGDWASCHAPINFFPYPPAPKDWANVMSFRSRHPGGATFCFADGSVRFISQTIDHSLYRSLSTKNGGESLSLP